MNKLKKAQSSWRRVFHKYFPYFSDLVEENVKNRCVFPLVILAIYIVLIFIIISTITEVFLFKILNTIFFLFKKNDNKPTTVKAKLDLSYNYYYSQKVSDDFPGARVKVLTNSVTIFFVCLFLIKFLIRELPQLMHN